MSSWSYEERVPLSEKGEKPDPPEILDTLMSHQEDRDLYEAAIKGDYQPEFGDPIKGTAYLVRGIKKAAHVEGPRPPIVTETLEYIAKIWPTGGEYNQRRWWMREELKKFKNAHSYVFSEATDPDTFFEDPRPEWYKQQQAAEADKHESQVRAAFWDCIQDAKGGMVFAHPSDVAAHPSVEVSEERVRDLLHDWEAVKSTDDPYDETPAPLNPRTVFTVVEE